MVPQRITSHVVDNYETYLILVGLVILMYQVDMSFANGGLLFEW